MTHEVGLANGSSEDALTSNQTTRHFHLSEGRVNGDSQGLLSESTAPDGSLKPGSQAGLSQDPPDNDGAADPSELNRPRLASVHFQHRMGDDATSSSASVWKDGESLSSEETVVQQLMRKISHVGNGDDGPKTAASYTSFPSGFQQRNYYEHSKKLTDLVDVTYNPRTRQFIFLDTRGITTWDKDGIEHTVNRSLSYPKYVNKLLRNIIYARKYNVYFCLAKDFSLKVLNKDFDETCNVASDLSSVMFLIFNPVRDELITGGVKGTKVWEFKQVTDQVWTEIKPMANYGLFLKRELSGIKGGWIRKVELEQHLQHLYCCSDTDVLCYNTEGKPLFRLVDAHKSQINGCKYSPLARALITCSNDCDVKVWSMTGGHIHTFRGHSRSVTGVVLHPETSTLVLTSSTDGTVRMWSLDIMEPMYTIVMSTDGIEWIGLTGEKFLWTATHRDLAVWHLNHVVQFYALARCRVTSLHVAGCEGKTRRLVAVGEDSSVRLISMRDQKSLSTVLPPPSISPLQQVLGVTYNRECSTVFLLINPREIWVYTMRTDPACRTAVWDVERLQDKVNRGRSAGSRATSAAPTTPRLQPASKGLSSVQLGHALPTYRATLQGRGVSQTPAPCTSITTVTSTVMYWADEGFVCPLNHNFLVLGLQDGRILFMDPIKYGHRYCELQASKDAIIDMEYDPAHSALVAKSHLRDEDVYQFWSLPSLELQYLVGVPRDVTGAARLGSGLLTGHSDGSLTLHHLKPATDIMGYSTNDGGEEATDSRRRDHTAPIIAVDSCPNLGIFVSCSSDGAVKVWDQDKLLLTEIALDEAISCARLINTRGDLMMGYLNHLFVIDHAKILPSLSKTRFPDENHETESEIYEDPAVRYEGAAANPDPLDLDNYLVPYNLDYSERFRGGRASPSSSHVSSGQSGDEGSDGEFSVAPTEMYMSPNLTPRRLSAVDLLTSGKEARKEDITSKVKALSLARKRQSRSSRLNLTQTDNVQQDFDMPEFGTSPGPSPTPSPPSSPSEFDVSEDESEIEDDSGEEAEKEGEESQDEKAGSKLIVKMSVSELEGVKRKEAKDIKAGDIRLSDLKQPPEEVSKYSLSRMKIDAKSLLKEKTPVAIPKPLKLERTSQPVMATVAEIKTAEDKVKKLSGQQRMKAPAKKKLKKGDRVRVGERAAANRAKLAAEPSSEAVISAPTAPTAGDTTTATKMTVSLESGVAEKAESRATEKVESGITKKVSDQTTKAKQRVSIPGLPKVPKETKSQPMDKKGPKPTDRSARARPERGRTKSILDDWKKPKASASSAAELNTGASDEEIHRAMSAGTSGSSGRPASSVHDVDVASDFGDGTTTMYKAAYRMAIANKYNPLRSKSPGAGPSLTDTRQDTIMLPDPEGLGEASELESLRPDSRFEAVQSRSSVQSALSLSKGRKSQMEGLDSDIEADQEPSTRAPSRNQISPEQVAVSLSAQPALTPPSRPKSRITLPPRPSRPADVVRDHHAMRDSRPDDRQTKGSEVFIPTVPMEEQVPLQEEMEGRLARPNTAEGRASLSQRPHTAGAALHVNFEDEALLDGCDTPVAKYLSCPGSPVDLRNIYRNDGLHFEENWQEKMIVRHHILRQQKEQRAQSAADRRRLLDLRKRQRRKALLGHHHCTAEGTDEISPQEVYVTRSDTAVHKTQRCQSAPSGRTVPSSPPVQPRQAFGQSKEPDLSSEMPYRLRINQAQPQSANPRLHPEDVFEEVAPDPSHPGSLLLKRPHSTKSIPSKTRRYVLVTKVREDPDIPVPTVLERQLLKDRFPQTRRRLKQLRELHRRASIPNMELVNISSVGDGPFS
ncbi:uncharacterized protein LOC110986955 isoform X2 [Acanthaster planci]|uniref:Uncharacterized protein LOC110986955 isoform X2 n=1 Tax=Acanthaster planci TaxID=133434 RepID=A0A8B7ZJE5_ACAPL|nr:uncharacterized protein LOC110986955 isoform X2 [Acanthaster planci]